MDEERLNFKNHQVTSAVDLIKNQIPNLQSMTIRGLNGYKDVTISFEAAIKVIAAENGAGKTTVMNALYAILTGKSEILKKINFSDIELKFVNNKIFKIDSADISTSIALTQAINESGFSEFLITRWNFNDSDIEDLVHSYRAGQLLDHPDYDRMYFNSPYNHDDIENAFGKLEALYGEGTSIWKTFHNSIKAAMGDVEVVYLPTYRRVEIEMPQFRRERQPRHRGLRKSERKPDNRDELINFGLSDIQEKLDGLLKDIKDRTLSAYSQISRNTLQQLARTSGVTDSTESFRADDIRVIFARLPDDNSAAERIVLGLIDDGQINATEHTNLRNFLSQLVDAFNDTKERESTISRFVATVNDYFSFGLHEKEMIYDKFKVEVSIKNRFSNDTLQLENLSSGEKQIVSIFSKLQLDRTKKVILLIDEPELSLSLDWQKWLLPDLWLTGSCVQIVAITHSPFIFDNGFSPFAGSMQITYTSEKNPSNV